MKLGQETIFLNYPKCSTCVKARKFLESLNVNFVDRHIVENNPNEEELKYIIQKSNLPIKKFFNTSGILYREMNLKDKLPELSEDEMIEILASNGMLVKRPILINKNGVLVGFKIDEWNDFFKNNKIIKEIVY